MAFVMGMFKEKFRKAVEEFIASSERRRWLEVGPLKMYVRKSVRLVDGRNASVFDVASVDVAMNEWGKGYFTSALGVVMELTWDSAFSAVMVESIINERLAEHFSRKHGWERYGVGGDENVNYMYRYAR